MGCQAAERGLRSRGRHFAVPHLVLTAGLDDETVADCVRAGAAGCVSADRPPAELARAIRQVHAGEVLFAPEALVRLLGLSAHRDPGPESPPRPLTARERQVLQALAEGLTVADVAERLVLSPHTVRSHLKTAMAKLGAHSRMEAVLRAVGAGLIELPAR